MFFGDIKSEIQIGQRIILNTEHVYRREINVLLSLSLLLKSDLILLLAQSIIFDDNRPTHTHMVDILSPRRCHLVLPHVDLSR